MWHSYGCIGFGSGLGCVVGNVCMVAYISGRVALIDGGVSGVDGGDYVVGILEIVVYLRWLVCVGDGVGRVVGGGDVPE